MPAFSELPSRNRGRRPGFFRGASAAAGTCWIGSRHSFLKGNFSGPSVLALLEGTDPEPLTTNANSLLPAPPPVPITDHAPAGGLSVWTLAAQNTRRKSALWCV